MYAAKTAQEISREAFQSTVIVIVENELGEQVSLGSGFYIGNNEILTNFHVVEEAFTGHVRLVGDTEKHPISSLLLFDPDKDIAVLSVSSLEAPVLTITDNPAMQVGDVVYAVGNPLGFEGTFSQGIISALRKFESQQFIQITAPISPGSSGGPILNNKGQVIGMLVSTIEGGQNINFAIPSNDIRGLLYRERIPMTLDREIVIKDLSHYTIGLAYYQRKFYNKSIIYLTKALEKNPEEVLVYYQRGKAYRKIKKLDKAIKDFTKSIYLIEAAADMLSPETRLIQGVYSARGGAYHAKEEYEKAIQDYAKARGKGDNSIILALNLATAYTRIGSYENALRIYNESIDAFSSSFMIDLVYFERGKFFWDRGQRGKAFEDLTRTIEINPQFAKCYFVRGVFYQKEHKYAEAIKDYSKVLEIYPDDTRWWVRGALTNRAVCWEFLGDFSRAISDYTRALAINPDEAYIYQSRGYVYRRIGAYQQAIRDFEKFLELEPSGQCAEKVRKDIQSLRRR